MADLNKKTSFELRDWSFFDDSILHSTYEVPLLRWDESFNTEYSDSTSGMDQQHLWAEDVPSSPTEEMDYMLDIEKEAADGMFVDRSPISEAGGLSNSFARRFEVTVKNLQESMKRSQETRLILKKRAEESLVYPRRESVIGAVKSVEHSSQSLQTCLSSAKLST